MISREYIEAVTELNDILAHTQKEYIEKVPRKLLSFFQDMKSNTYVPNIDYTKPIESQIKDKTKALIGMLYRNYWCNEKERTEYDRILLENEIKYQEDLRQKYNPDNIFNKQEEIIKKDICLKEEIALVQYKEPWYKVFFEKILGIFRRR